MYTKTEGYTVAIDKTTGNDATSKQGTKLAITSSGRNIWFPKTAALGKYITCKVHEKGDTFVANADSKRTKGEVMGKDCPAGQEGEPLYLEGETVVRNQEFVEFIGFTEHKEVEEVSLEKKLELMAKYGLKVSL